MPATFPTTATFGSLVVLLNTGTSAAPVWKAPCGFDSKSATKSASSSEANIPQCNNPDAPGWTARGITALSLQVQGSGVMALEDSPMWEAFFDSGLPMTICVYTVGDTGYREGPAILTSLGDSASRSQNGNLIQRAVTLDSAGPFPWTIGQPPAGAAN